MPTAGELCGGFWDGSGVSPVVDAYAAAAALLGDNATGQGAPAPLRGWTLRADQLAVGAAGNGRPTYGYPAPAETPAWVAPDPTGSVLTSGVDFSTSGGYVWFNADPLPTAPAGYLTWPGGLPVAVADVWYAPNPTADNVTPYQDATYAALAAALAAACDSPASGPTVETVLDVWRGPDGAWRVVTDAAGYRLPSSPVVAVGNVLAPLSPLGGAWALTRLGPYKPALTYLTTPGWFHQNVAPGGITWYDQTVSLVVDVVGGRTRVRWALGGASQGDVDAFWAESHNRGTAAGAKSLAQAMDLRATPVGDPGPESLPLTVNPLDFVCRQLFGGNAYLSVVSAAAFGPNAASDAARQAAVRAAAGPYVAAFEYAGAPPALAVRTPS